ncbi:MAG: hypothetical protein E7644_01075 [Ruminococcaceae bacterium]|nr:hypothetical protein [Oscillospiraceae bacterium]
MKKGICITPKDMREGLADRLRAEGITLAVLWPEKEKGSVLGLECLARDVKFGRYHQQMLELKEKGIDVEYGAYSASSFLPRAFFGVYPYWFRMNEAGVRVPDANFCPSAEGAADYIAWRAGSVGSILRSTTHRYHFLPDKEVGALCHCPACRHLTPAEQRMIYIRAVLRGLREKDAEAKVCYPVWREDATLPKCREEEVFLSCSDEVLEAWETTLFPLFSRVEATVTVEDRLQLERLQDRFPEVHDAVLSKK